MIRVAVMGCGIVGSGVVKMLTDNQDAIKRAAGAKVQLTHVLDIRPVEAPAGAKHTANFEDLLGEKGLDIAVETIGGVGVAYEYTKRLLSAGVSVVSSNKELVAERGDELTRLAAENKAVYLYEASVGGGVPILRPLRTCLAGNHIRKIEGIVNGSTNYLLTRMERVGLSFPAALAEAKELGYVEGNPAADIEGWDARRKLGILASAAFGSALSDSQSIPTEGIARVTERDLACAHELGGTIKLIAHAECWGEHWSGWVHPALVRQDHPLRGVNDVFNGIVVSGDFVGDVMFTGRGAGSLPTASAIVGDIIESARGAKPKAPKADQLRPAFRSPDTEPAKLMVRVETQRPDEVKSVAAALMPGAQLSKVGDMLMLLTPEQPLSQLMEKLSCLKAGDVRAGIPIRVL